MPYLISFSYQHLRRTMHGVSRGEPQQTVIATTRTPAAFLIHAMEILRAFEDGVEAHQSAEDILAILSAIEIDDDDYVALNNLL